MSIIEVLQAAALMSVIWGIVSAIAIGSYLRAYGYEVNVLLYRFLLFKYMRQYAELTTQQEGRPGFWYYSYVISMLAVLGCIVIWLSIR